MKTKTLSIVLSGISVFILLMGVTLMIHNFHSFKPQIKENPISEKPYVPQIKVVFVVTNPDIDFNQMDITEVTNIITQDSILQISPLSAELYLKPQVIKVYKIEDITCPYLKKKFKDNKPGELVYEYNGKVLIKLKDGVIKVYHSHLDEKN